MAETTGTLKIGVSGVRGVIGESLTPAVVVTFAQAFGSYIGRGPILVGRDTRVSGPMLEHAVLAGLLAVGCRPIVAGVCPVPSLMVLTKARGAAGAIAITASHNPIEWNALKFIGPGGLFLNATQAEELLDVYHQMSFSLVDNSGHRPVVIETDPTAPHLERLLAVLDVERISAAHLKVAVDCCNGAGAVLTPTFLERLGTAVTAIHAEPNGLFPRPPEPLPENITALCDAVRRSGADVGFAQDADADRLAVVDETGRPIGEEYTLALAADYYLRKRAGPVVVNLSVSRTMDDIARRHGCELIRTKIGEVNVTEQLLARNAVIGGEPNGGVIVPAVHPCRDSYAAMGLLLESLASSKRRLSQLVEALPRYVSVKEKRPCRTRVAHRIVGELQRRITHGQVTLVDGIRVDFEDSWLHVRPSNTEPVLRILVEAKTKAQAEELHRWVKREIEAIAEKVA